MASIEEIVKGVIARAEENPVFRNLLETNTLEVLQAEGLTSFTADLNAFLGRSVTHKTEIGSRTDNADTDISDFLMRHIQKYYPESELARVYSQKCIPHLGPRLLRDNSPHC